MAGDVFVTERQTVHAVSQFLIVNDLDFMPAREKDGAMPRAEGKRYSRTHLAYLTALCALKQVLSVKDAGLLLAAASEGRPPQKLYEQFREELDRALDVTAGSLDGSAEAEELPGLALALALRSYADRLACQRILELLRERRPQPEKNRK